MAAATAVEKTLAEFLSQVAQAGPRLGINVADFPAGVDLLRMSREQQVHLVLEAVKHLVPTFVHWHEHRPTSVGDRQLTDTLALKALLGSVLRKQLPFSLEQLATLVDGLARTPAGYQPWMNPGGILKAVEQHVGQDDLPPALRPVLEAFRNSLQGQPPSTDSRRTLDRLDALLDESPTIPMPAFGFKTDEAWTRQASKELVNLADTARDAWHRLLDHCAAATSAKPSRKWQKGAEALVTAIGADAFADVAERILAEIGKPGTPETRMNGGFEVTLDPSQIHDKHSDMLRGLVWCAAAAPRESLLAVVGDAADICFKKIPNIGPRAPKIGNACLFALSQVPQTGAVAQLSRLKTRVKHASVRSQLAKALDRAADNAGLTPAELEEVSVPTCGLTEVGESTESIGDFTARLAVTDGTHVELTWIKQDGKTQTSLPAALKESHPDAVKALKQREKEIAKLLAAQRDRIEQFFWQPRDWSRDDLQERYLNHPLVGVIARRLIWTVRDGENSYDAIWHDGKLVTETDRPVTLSEGVRIALWHPQSASVGQVKAWRDWLDAHEVRQPFKQAHREIYLLTDAERTTGTYSNRFAAHIIRQHQFTALCQQRGWRYTLQGSWDSANTPTLHLPHWNLRAEFWAEAAPEGPEMGVYAHLATDQVRFYRQDETEPLPLTDVPPLAFSEVMRDVDLFVGVASVGNDPNWADGGPEGRYRDYWQSYSFGELSASAQTRKAVLEKVVPRLKIAKRCALIDKFLVVRGDLHTYKIHLGSGNILMSPNDQYLCIVPRQGAGTNAANIFLPYDGDNMLSIILSKAILLADDTKIKDPSIVSQIGGSKV
jgi:hypothetical protein